MTMNTFNLNLVSLTIESLKKEWYDHNLRVLIHTKKLREFDTPYTLEDVRLNPKKCAFVGACVSWEDICMNSDIQWDYDMVSSNPHVTWEIVCANPHINWSYRHLMTTNPNIGFDIIKNDVRFTNGANYKDWIDSTISLYGVELQDNEKLFVSDEENELDVLCFDTFLARYYHVLFTHSALKHELMMKIWHPSNMKNWKKWGCIEDDDDELF